MKIHFAIFLGFLLVSCNKQKPDIVKTTPAETVATFEDTSNEKKTEVVKNEAVVKDTTKIAITVNNEELEFNKSQVAEIKEYFNVINRDFIVNPDITYAKSQECNFENLKKLSSDFNSEVGQDTFYILYTYFLQQKNGVKPHDGLRKKLLNLFTSINELNKNLQYGGTYFMHQYSRINGYVEYEVYLSIDDDWYKKKYSIVKQKNMFLESLRQHVLDEEKFDYNTLGKEKIVRRQKLLKIIDEIGSQITTFYDLRKAQEFQYSYYNWL